MERISTGNRNLDRILCGGLPRHSINMVMGLPGTGKTILAQQLVFATGTAERPALYVTTISEPLPKVVTYLQGMRFADLDRLGREVRYHSLAEALQERPDQLDEHIAELIQEHRPQVIVIDSFKAIMELVPEPTRWRTAVFALAQIVTAYDLTTVWVGEYDSDAISRLPEFAVADGILQLRRTFPGSRDDRFLQVMKLRGSSFLDGEHAFTLSAAGLEVFPRLVGPPPAQRAEPVERLQTGIDGLDSMVETGWLRGTSTLVAGPSGAGKTMLGLHFLRHGVEQGEPGLLVNFQESPGQLHRAMASLGWDGEALMAAGLDILHTSPVELQMDTIVQEMLRRIAGRGVRRIVIDALGDLERAAADPRRFSDYVYALTQEFASHRLTALLMLETPAGPNEQRWSGEEISYMSDNILLLSMDMGEDLVRTIRVVKTRGSAHDGRRHVLRIGHQGIAVE
ncbi:MAG TPA: ATPase domain-containing protein [Thermoanaerobaculia bacterium]|nr:ATPase domain-containing protein [Thermoanaerobaculia bacterium]